MIVAANPLEIIECCSFHLGTAQRSREFLMIAFSTNARLFFDAVRLRKGEVARDRLSGMAVYLHRSRLQPVPIAKSNGQSINGTRFVLAQ